MLVNNSSGEVGCIGFGNHPNGSVGEGWAGIAKQARLRHAMHPVVPHHRAGSDLPSTIGEGTRNQKNATAAKMRSRTPMTYSVASSCALTPVSASGKLMFGLRAGAVAEVGPWLRSAGSADGTSIGQLPVARSGGSRSLACRDRWAVQALAGCPLLRFPVCHNTFVSGDDEVACRHIGWPRDTAHLFFLSTAGNKHGEVIAADDAGARKWKSSAVTSGGWPLSARPILNFSASLTKMASMGASTSSPPVTRRTTIPVRADADAERKEANKGSMRLNKHEWGSRQAWMGAYHGDSILQPRHQHPVMLRR